MGKPPTGHTGAVLSVAFGTGPDGRLLLASGSEDKTVRLWEPATPFRQASLASGSAADWRATGQRSRRLRARRIERSGRLPIVVHSSDDQRILGREGAAAYLKSSTCASRSVVSVASVSKPAGGRAQAGRDGVDWTSRTDVRKRARSTVSWARQAVSNW